MKGYIAHAIDHGWQVVLAIVDAFRGDVRDWDWEDIELELDEWEKWKP